VDGGRQGATLRLFELRYEDSGVGMPTDVEGGFRLEDGRFVLTMDREFKKVPIMVSIVPGHGIVVGGRFLAFVTWAKEGQGLVLEGRMAGRFLFRR
jgi:hypothetical protein